MLMRHTGHHHSHSRKRHTPGNYITPSVPDRGALPNSEGAESSYMKSLIESRSKVTVILKNGEKLQGRIRYYDRDCFSVGLTTEKRKVFLRKENVSYIAEEK